MVQRFQPPLPLVLLVIGLAGARPAAAQARWSATLAVDPFPSPYLSDWETNPTLSSLTIVNPGTAERDVTLVYQVVDQAGRVAARGRSDATPIPAGAPTIFTSYIDIAGTSTRDRTIEDQVQRTGRLPEGTYTACVTMTDANRFVLAESCASFRIVYPDSPVLIAPADGEVIAAPAPFFQWTPIVVPPAYQVRYVLQIARLLPNQTAEEALNASIPFFLGPDLDVTNVQYPLDGQPFEQGQRYVWRVLALDQNGFPPSTNNGSSPIRSFRFDANATGTGQQRTEVTLSLANTFDTSAPDVATRGQGGGGGPPANPPGGGGGGPGGGTPGSSTPGSEPAGSSIDIADLCANWNTQIAEITVSADSPIGLRRFAGQPAVVHRDSAAVRWWIATKNRGVRSVLIGGDCAGDRTRTKWIASKDTSLQNRISEKWRATPSGGLSPASVFDSLSFGMVVLALGNDEVSAPDSFPEGTAFLGGRTLEVHTGLNTYAVLSLPEWGLWDFFQSIGFGEKEIEVKGFLGWNAEWNIGGAVGKDAGVDLSTERKFLVLTAELPKRKPVGPLEGVFQESGLSLEITVGDSTGRGFGPEGKQPGYSLDLVGKLIHTVKINDELSLVGSFGFDLARESKKGPLKEQLERWDFLGRPKRWVKGKVQGVTGRKPAAPELFAAPSPAPPEIGVDIVVSYGFEGRLGSIWRSTPAFVRLDGMALDAKIRPNWNRKAPEPGKEKEPALEKMTLALSATFGIGAVDGAVKVGLSKEFSFDKKPPPDTVALKKQIAAKAITVRMLSMPPIDKLPECDKSGATDNSDYCKTLREGRSLQKQLEDARSKSWRFRLSAGHISLGEALDLFRSIGAGNP